MAAFLLVRRRDPHKTLEGCEETKHEWRGIVKGASLCLRRKKARLVLQELEDTLLLNLAGKYLLPIIMFNVFCI